jgi:hypothetical protein
VQFSPVSLYSLPSSPKYTPQHATLEYPQLSAAPIRKYQFSHPYTTTSTSNFPDSESIHYLSAGCNFHEHNTNIKLVGKILFYRNWTGKTRKHKHVNPPSWRRMEKMEIKLRVLLTSAPYRTTRGLNISNFKSTAMFFFIYSTLPLYLLQRPVAIESLYKMPLPVRTGDVHNRSQWNTTTQIWRTIQNKSLWQIRNFNCSFTEDSGLSLASTEDGVFETSETTNPATPSTNRLPKPDLREWQPKLQQAPSVSFERNSTPECPCRRMLVAANCF